ncbi:hypothetical protein [Roseovarius sp.]|uniref:YdcH family protein n=1 Tax=Roseovarius sp. TaxID=1486281 RepID=UPI0026333B00|nr:hypothetical protein [Roseovarius sp.]MDM8166432.1 hypothetical protein [Roseovarius sp.]
MSQLPKEFYDEFPDHADQIKKLEAENPDFRAKALRYHELQRAAHRAEMDEEPQSQEADVQLMKERDTMRDELMRHIMI